MQQTQSLQNIIRLFFPNDLNEQTDSCHRCYANGFSCSGPLPGDIYTQLYRWICKLYRSNSRQADLAKTRDHYKHWIRMSSFSFYWIIQIGSYSCSEHQCDYSQTFVRCKTNRI